MTRRLLQAGSVLGAAVGAITSAAAAICCIGPLAIALLGVLALATFPPLGNPMASTLVPVAAARGITRASRALLAPLPASALAA